MRAERCERSYTLSEALSGVRSFARAWPSLWRGTVWPEPSPRSPQALCAGLSAEHIPESERRTAYKEESMSLQAVKKLVVTSGRHEYVPLQREELLEHLIDQIAAHSSTSPAKVLRRTSEVLDEIIFEANINGIHYYLVRSQPQSASQVSLSPRELAIARLIAKGLPNKCIGDILEISPWTVATHLRRIFVKLGVTSRAAMVARLGEENLL
jgi:two-component system nitrate/nitrite response regulator NarL